jgi:hypothetical protein
MLPKQASFLLLLVTLKSFYLPLSSKVDKEILAFPVLKGRMLGLDILYLINSNFIVFLVHLDQRSR